jgi:hypothetical protein
VPPCALIISWQITSPNPVPSPGTWSSRTDQRSWARSPARFPDHYRLFQITVRCNDATLPAFLPHDPSQGGFGGNRC